MNVSRKIIYPIVFLIALTAAIIITKLAQTRFHILPSSPAQSAAPSTPMVTAEEATPITYQVQQSSADFSTGRSYLTLRLERNANEAMPERLWVWSHYFSPDEPGRGGTVTPPSYAILLRVAATEQVRP